MNDATRINASDLVNQVSIARVLGNDGREPWPEARAVGLAPFRYVAADGNQLGPTSTIDDDMPGRDVLLVTLPE